MIVCNCNALNERKVDAAIQAGAESWRDVQMFHGCVPDCGACECEITERIKAQKLRNLTTRPTSTPETVFLSAAE